VLAEPALAALCGVDEPFGQEVRRSVAEAAVNPAIDSWEYRYERTRKGTRVARFVHRHGLHGEADPSLAGTAATGDLFDLGPIGVVPDQGNEFPVLRLDIDPAEGDDLVSGVVVGRFQPFRVTVDVNKGRQVKVYAPNSYLTPGTRVLLQGDDPDRLRYVGSLQEPLPLVGSGGVEMAAISVIATVSNHRKGHAYGVTVEDSVEVFIPSGADPTEVGGRYLVSLVGSGRDPQSPFVAHLASTMLPT